MPGQPVMIAVDTLTDYVDHAVDALCGIVAGLGDDLANQRPDLPGANSPYAILTHCLGVMADWGGHVVAGRDVQRDRPAEFTAAGRVADLVAAAEQARLQFRADALTADPQAAPRGRPPAAARTCWRRAARGMPCCTSWKSSTSTSARPS